MPTQTRDSSTLAALSHVYTARSLTGIFATDMSTPLQESQYCIYVILSEILCLSQCLSALHTTNRFNIRIYLIGQECHYHGDGANSRNRLQNCGTRPGVGVKWHKRPLWGHNLGINRGPATLINNLEDYFMHCNLNLSVEGTTCMSLVYA